MDIYARALASKINSLSEQLNNITAPKNNLSATSAPTANDDASNGYTDGSVWVYNNTTYTCTDSTTGSARWSSSADLFYYETWNDLISAISVNGTSLVHKFAIVTNANGGAPSGVTFTYGDILTNAINDGGSATYYINSQGSSSYSVTCQKRTVSNPVITNIMTTASAKPTVAGYYVFSVIPTDGLPVGCSKGDICYFDGSVWSRFQSYASANSSIIVGTTLASQRLWKKSGGYWRSDSFGTSSNKVTLASNKSVSSNVLTDILSLTTTVPSGGNYKAMAFWQIMIVSGASDIAPNAYVTDGTNAFAGAQYFIKSVETGAFNTSSISDVDYVGGTSVTFSLKMIHTTGTSTVNANSHSGNASVKTFLKIVFIPA